MRMERANLAGHEFQGGRPVKRVKNRFQAYGVGDGQAQDQGECVKSSTPCRNQAAFVQMQSCGWLQRIERHYLRIKTGRNQINRQIGMPRMNIMKIVQGRMKGEAPNCFTTG